MHTCDRENHLAKENPFEFRINFFTTQSDMTWVAWLLSLQTNVRIFVSFFFFSLLSETTRNAEASRNISSSKLFKKIKTPAKKWELIASGSAKTIISKESLSGLSLSNERVSFSCNGKLFNHFLLLADFHLLLRHSLFAPCDHCSFYDHAFSYVRHRNFSSLRRIYISINIFTWSKHMSFLNYYSNVCTF